MTVHELIDALKKMPDDALVFVESPHHDEVTYVALKEDGTVKIS